MPSRELLRDLLRHMEWADARVWAAVPTEEPADPRLHRLLLHIHTVQFAFLTIWRGGDLNEVFNRASAASSRLADVVSWAHTYYPQAYAFLDALHDEGLAQPVEMPWAAEVTNILGRVPGVTTLAETVVQVTSHSTYHRGQVNLCLRDLGAEPPLVDYIAWLWNGRPAAEWKA
jgi:uncharacterized damage-inducible protein DinB